jgi:hypothetical protein
MLTENSESETPSPKDFDFADQKYEIQKPMFLSKHTSNNHTWASL